MSSKLEQHIYKLLKDNHIPFQTEKTFKDLKGGLLRYDIYLPYVQGGPIILEVDGQFHFEPIHGREVLLKQQENDRRKNSYCLAKGIPLYRIPYWDIYSITNVNDLVKDKYLVRSKWHNDRLEVPK